MNKLEQQSPVPHYSSHSGFTLIELIVVIVILGTLAAVAVPKFVRMKQEAIVATMRGLNGALNSAATLVHSKAAAQGLVDQASATLDIGGTTVDIVYGYPSGTQDGMARIVEAPGNGWKERASVYDGAWVYWHGEIPVDAGTAQCYLRYRQPTAAGARPVIDFEDSGCGRY